jgi:hypothetical protein
LFVTIVSKEYKEQKLCGKKNPLILKSKYDDDLEKEENKG